MARTTVDIDSSVLDEAKRRAAAEGKTLGRLISELLARSLAPADRPALADLAWESAPLGARVDLEDWDAVWQLLDIETGGPPEAPP